MHVVKMMKQQYEAAIKGFKSLIYNLENKDSEITMEVGAGAKTINVFRAWIGAQLTFCAQK